MIKMKSIIEGKYDIHSAKEFLFVTYGGLKAVKQRGYDASFEFDENN